MMLTGFNSVRIDQDRISSIFRLALMIIGIVILSLPDAPYRCWAAGSDQTGPNGTGRTDFTEMSLEDLLDVEVTSVSKKSQKLSNAPAAVFVISQEDIRRSGVTNIPDALRMVPGLQVAGVDSNNWAVTARGFNGNFANKLLVLIDGRSVYTPLFSGVFWDTCDAMLEDIDRIEVIRGPGASLWGANAVNGVINIITSSAENSQGVLLSGGFGNEEEGFGNARYGGELGDVGHYRLYGKYFNRDGTVQTSGRQGNDQWDSLQSGFRTDVNGSDRDHFTFQGDISQAHTGGKREEFYPAPPYSAFVDNDGHLLGLNILARWRHLISDSSEMELQIYYDRDERNTSTLDFVTENVDLDFQHQFQLGARNAIIWGLGYRLTKDDIQDTFSYAFNPDDRDVNLFSGFIQDDVTLVSEKLYLTLGSKFEHNDYTGFEIQPNLRLLYTPKPNHSLWAAVSRAVRTPSRGEQDATLINQVFPPNALFPGSPLMFVDLSGDQDYISEELIAYEAGYRFRPAANLSMDLAAFINDYDHLRTIEPVSMTSFQIGNKLRGYTYGLELTADYRAMDWWRLQAGYTFIKLDLELDSDSGDTASEDQEHESPRHQLSLRSSMDLPHDVELDFWLRAVDNLDAKRVDSYYTCDLRLAWSALKNLELALVGRNLLEGRHLEFRQELLSSASSSEIERSIYAMVTWRF